MERNPMFILLIVFQLDTNNLARVHCVLSRSHVCCNSHTLYILILICSRKTYTNENKEYSNTF
jgi:hypothetical protein